MNNSRISFISFWMTIGISLGSISHERQYSGNFKPTPYRSSFSTPTDPDTTCSGRYGTNLAFIASNADQLSAFAGCDTGECLTGLYRNPTTSIWGNLDGSEISGYTPVFKSGEGNDPAKPYAILKNWDTIANGYDSSYELTAVAVDHNAYPLCNDPLSVTAEYTYSGQFEALPYRTTFNTGSPDSPNEQCDARVATTLSAIRTDTDQHQAFTDCTTGECLLGIKYNSISQNWANIDGTPINYYPVFKTGQGNDANKPYAIIKAWDAVDNAYDATYELTEVAATYSGYALCNDADSVPDVETYAAGTYFNVPYRTTINTASPNTPTESCYSKYGTSLLSIKTDADQQAAFAQCETGECLTGLYRNPITGVWVNVDKTPITYFPVFKAGQGTDPTKPFAILRSWEAVDGYDTTYELTEVDGSYNGYPLCNSLVDECALDHVHQCSANAICTDNTNGYSCACKTGYIGDGYTCSCPTGYTGDACAECDASNNYYLATDGSCSNDYFSIQVKVDSTVDTQSVKTAALVLSYNSKDYSCSITPAAQEEYKCFIYNSAQTSSVTSSDTNSNIGSNLKITLNEADAVHISSISISIGGVSSSYNTFCLPDAYREVGATSSLSTTSCVHFNAAGVHSYTQFAVDNDEFLPEVRLVFGESNEARLYGVSMKQFYLYTTSNIYSGLAAGSNMLLRAQWDNIVAECVLQPDASSSFFICDVSASTTCADYVNPEPKFEIWAYTNWYNDLYIDAFGVIDDYNKYYYLTNFCFADNDELYDYTRYTTSSSCPYDSSRPQAAWIGLDWADYEPRYGAEFKNYVLSTNTGDDYFTADYRIPPGTSDACTGNTLLQDSNTMSWSSRLSCSSPQITLAKNNPLNVDNNFGDNTNTIQISSEWLLFIAVVIGMVLLLNIYLFCKLNCCDTTQKYAKVQFEDSEYTTDQQV